jgi:hypothetical protein
LADFLIKGGQAMSKPTPYQVYIIEFYGLNPAKHMIIKQTVDSLLVWHKKKHKETLLRR